MAAGLSDADQAVAPLVRKAAAWSWRLLVIFAAVFAVLWVIKRLEVILVPVALATMVAALLLPAVDFLDRRGAPRGVAVALMLLSGFAVVGGILTFVVSQFVEGVPALAEQVGHSIEGLGNWLANGPLQVGGDQIEQVREGPWRRCATTRRS